MSDERSEAASFEALAMPLFARLYNFAHWLTQNRDDAEDLVQETYVKALRGFSGFQPGSNFRAWIYRILRNTFLTSRSGLKAISPVPLEDEQEAPAVLLATSDTPESLLLSRADQEMIRAALERLPVHFREVILLCDLEEMSYQEIADMLAIPIGTVMSRLSRARKALRQLLMEHMRGASHGLRVAQQNRPVR